MLSRLWQWARGDSKPAPQGTPSGIVPSAPPALPPREEPFFTQLARELPLAAEILPEHEPQITDLVMQVVTFVTQKKLDPPVVPALVPRVLAIVGEPEVDLQRLTHVVQQDLAISAKLLSVANSPLFGGGADIKTVRQAIAHLGSEQVAQVAIGLACRSSMESDKRDGVFASRWQRLFQHGMTCALAAAQLTGKQDRAAQEAAFLGGLFHDVSKAVALRAVEALIDAGKLALPAELVLDEALQRIHAYPGDEFFQKWTLPEPLMQLCTQHHQLEELEGAPLTLYRVTLTSSFDALLSGTDASRRDALHEARISAERLGLSDAALRAAYANTRALGDKATRMFGT
ncbi:MAG TPA: HDOD domain-containing protein [Polyangiales bacterium]